MAEVKRLVGLLRAVIRVFGTNREVERKLGMRPGYLSRIFGGAVELRAEHILAVCRALELQPGEFFALAFPGAQAPVTKAGRKLFGELRPSGPEAPVGPQAPVPQPPRPGTALTLEEVDARIRGSMGDFLLAFGKLLSGGGQR